METIITELATDTEVLTNTCIVVLSQHRYMAGNRTTGDVHSIAPQYPCYVVLHKSMTRPMQTISREESDQYELDRNMYLLISVEPGGNPHFQLLSQRDSWHSRGKTKQ